MYIGIIVLIQSVAVIIFMRSCINRFKQLEDSINYLNSSRTSDVHPIPFIKFTEAVHDSISAIYRRIEKLEKNIK